MSDAHSLTTEQTLAGLWAKRYVQQLRSSEQSGQEASLSGRGITINKLMGALRFASSQAWAQTEKLLFTEVQRHNIPMDLIDPWQIAEDSRLLFQKALDSYAGYISPQRFSVVISPHCGRIRRTYTAQDPRVLGFMSMQFHYTGQILLEQLTLIEQHLVRDYFKVIDDHLYMPLQRSYEAAAQYPYESPILDAVRLLLPISTRIAEYICGEVAHTYPEQRCHTGFLKDPQVRISSIRDVEMFQLYLCLCAMEGQMSAVQQELFPLCVMLYPPLNVPWEMVRHLVRLLSQEIQMRLPIESYLIFAPYLQAFDAMFSLDVFPADNPIWSNHPDTIRFMDSARRLMVS